MTDKETLRLIALACAVFAVIAVAITAGCIVNGTSGSDVNKDTTGDNNGISDKQETPNKDVLPSQSTNKSVLTGTEWILESIANESGLEPVQSGVTVTLIFDVNTLGGNGGCNGYGADYTTEGNNISINQENFISTLMYCDYSSPTEAAYKAALKDVTSYKLSEDKLELLDNEGRTLLVFKKITESHG